MTFCSVDHPAEKLIGLHNNYRLRKRRVALNVVKAFSACPSGTFH